MTTEMLMNQMEQDFRNLMIEHEVAASNERLWAKGSPDAETASMHEENAAGHVALAKIYHEMMNHTLAFIETYEDYLN